MNDHMSQILIFHIPCQMSGIEEIRSVPLPLKPQYGEILIWTFWAKIREKDNGGGLALPGMSLAGCGLAAWAKNGRPPPPPSDQLWPRLQPAAAAASLELLRRRRGFLNGQNRSIFDPVLRANVARTFAAERLAQCS